MINAIENSITPYNKVAIGFTGTKLNFPTNIDVPACNNNAGCPTKTDYKGCFPF